MDNNMLLRVQDLVENPTPRVPICLCLDTSGSMGAVEGDCVPTGETIFEDGREFLEALALETPELVLMDIMVVMIQH